MSDIRPNWREIDILDLTDAEVALMTDEEVRWCSDLLVKRHFAKAAPAPAPIEAVEAPTAEPLNFEPWAFAVTDGGARIRIWPNESSDPRCFTGELLNPTEREMRGQAHISTLWDRSKVVRIEPEIPA